ncbi:outer membrane lipoprotein carrier protein LolA [Imhoffiella purpurea]|uniref:Putative transmembrane protein n=1 Tax=Imhoffiella purpurea TaxID=1249627 RepID=W9VJI9_9GAMM|nr:outer membrane lipoprotein carrier protein LolA [Imhoffiella purpurea]EXJ16232.1 Putative transmembrane protein [Imhoffiella purpurea]
MRSLAQVTQVEAEYRERVELSLLDQPLESSGHLSYQAPDRLSKTSDKGDAVLIDGDRIELIRGDGKTRLRISDHAALEGIVLALRATFAGDLDRLRRLYRLDYQSRPDGWTLELVPLERGIANLFQSVRIEGVDNRIDRLDILEGNGDRRRMRLTNQRLLVCPGPGNGCRGTP